jgi:hypothetical protein
LQQHKIAKEIEDKLAEFNQLYKEVSGDIEAITKLLPPPGSSIGRSMSPSYLEWKGQSQGSTLEVDDPGLNTPKQSSIRP